MSSTSRTRGADRRTPRGVWMSPANGSPLHSPMKMSTSYSPFHDTHRSPARKLFGGPGWRTLKDAIKDGTFTYWKSGNNLASGFGGNESGLWSELHRQHPVQMQISHDKETQVDKLFGQHVGIWFVIGEPFAKGGFGEVRFGYHKSMSVKKFAVKIEPVNHNGMRHLSAEYNIYSILGDSSGIPRCYYYGLCGIMHNALVMDLLGPSLDDVFESMKRKFTLRTVLLIALQAFDRLHYLHSRGVVHGDVKGENFLIGLPNEGLDTVIYIVDFGLSQVLKDHIKNVYLYNENSIVSPSGTPRYMSISAHSGNALSFRDDLESLAYVLVYFLRGRLPWQGIHEKDASKKSAIIKSRKMEETLESICLDCPEEFAQFLNYARVLRFQEEPDYEYLRGLFRDLLDRTNADDPVGEGEKPMGFDWIGKTFSFRKEPTKHPILPRAEFQKKISVPSLLPNEKLRLLHKQQSSATQLSVRSAVVKAKAVSPTELLHPLTYSPSAPHIDQTPIDPRHLRVPLVTNKPSEESKNKDQSATFSVSPRLQENSVDVSLEDRKDELSLVAEASFVPSFDQLEIKFPSRPESIASSKRQRKISIVSSAPIRRSLLSINSSGAANSAKVTTSPLAQVIVSAAIKFPPTALSESHSRTGETSLTDSSRSGNSRKSTGSDRFGLKPEQHPFSRKHSNQRIEPAPLSSRLVSSNENGKIRTLTHSNVPPIASLLSINGLGNEMGTPRRHQPDGVEFPGSGRGLGSPGDMLISVTTPHGTLKKNRARAMLPRSGLRQDENGGKKPVVAQIAPVTSTPAGMQIMDPKSLHRINVYDVKRDGEAVLPTSLRSVGCFTWLRRRTLCGAKRNRSVRALPIPLGVNGQPKSKIG